MNPHIRSPRGSSAGRVYLADQRRSWLARRMQICFYKGSEMTKYGNRWGQGWLVAGTFALLAASSPRALAQAVYGQILGTVTDATVAAVPGATVTVTDVGKGTSITLQSNSAGEFTAEHLAPDIYSVKVTSAGFKTYEQQALQVFADTSPKVRGFIYLTPYS